MAWKFPAKRARDHLKVLRWRAMLPLPVESASEFSRDPTDGMLVYPMYMMLPEWWDSLETVARVHHKVRLILSVVSGTVAAFATILLYVVGNRKEALVAAEKRGMKELISGLEKTQRPRKLSIDEQEDLRALLAPYKGRTANIHLHADTEEATQFRQQLIEVFTKAEWLAGGGHSAGQSREGLVINGNFRDEGDPAQLLSEFLENKIHHRTQHNASGELYIMVGSKETTTP